MKSKKLIVNEERNRWNKDEKIGVALVILSLIILLFKPSALSNLFETIIDKVSPIVIDIFLTSEVGIAIIVSVIVGKVLERLGFTDGLIRMFLPIMKVLKINPSVVIPSIYNILGDINAAGKIAAPVLTKAKATKAEQKIAIATMIQSPQSFVTFVIGLIALNKFGIKPLPIIILSIFVPLILVPFILSKTCYRDTKEVHIEDLPRFTPQTSYLQTIFDSAREGAELLFLVIIPAVAAVFTIIGVLEFAGIWQFIETGLASFLQFLSIEPNTGIISILASPTLAMAQLAEITTKMSPKLVVGSFVLACSGLPLSVIVGQVPVTWAEVSDLNEREIIISSMLGTLIRLITAFLIAYFITPFVI